MEMKYILFDLDGTISNSYSGIIRSYHRALRDFNIEIRPELDRKLIGPPIVYSMVNYYGLSEEQGSEIVRRYRQYYMEDGIYDFELYPDIREAIMTLAAHGKKLMLATSKPEHMAVKVLEHADLAQYFLFIAGANAEYGSGEPNVRADKIDIIRYLLETNDIKDVENAVMIGDTSFDIRAAKKLGLRSIGVTYGFGAPEELRLSGANFLAQTPMDFVRYIIEQE